MKGIVVPVRGLVGLKPGLASRALAPRPVSGLVDAAAFARALHAPCLLACGLGCSGLGLWTTTGPVGFAHTLLAVLVWRDCSLSHGSRYRSWDRSLLSSDHSRSRDRSWWPRRSCRDREEAVAASRDGSNSGSRVELAPVVAGSSSSPPAHSFFVGPR